jgi:anthranilate phosphoribosyltransferase
MSHLASLTSDLAAGRELAPEQVAFAGETLASPGEPDAAKADFLVALARKGETAAEVAGFARKFRDLAFVGTGGDHAGGFNVSSVAMLVLACAGVPTMKHGNRGITSQCGSADLLGALGVDVAAPPEKLRQGLAELGFVFFFAPRWHPAFLRVSPVRKALAAQGQRTVFNLLGPLINPGRPAHALVGVYAEAWVSPLAEALGALGTRSGLVAHGKIDATRGIDEITTATVNRVRGCGQLSGLATEWRAEDFGLAPAPFAELRGGDLAANLALLEAVLDGRGPAGLVDTITLNAAVAQWIVNPGVSVAERVGAARELLLGGAVRAKIAATREFFRP